MKKLMVVCAMLAVSGAVSAEEKGTEFKFGGEIRERFYLNDNPTYLESSKKLVEQSFNQRAQFHVNAISGDKLQAYLNLISISNWGSSGTQAGCSSTACNGYSTTGAGVPGANANGTNNTPVINEAWFWWKTSDSLALKSGRQTLNWGDGLVFSKNDWTSPYSHDAIMGRFSMDFMDLDFGGGKISDAGVTTTPGTDTETVFYALYASIKNLPEVLKAADVYLFQFNGDGTSPDTMAFPGVAATAATQSAWGLTHLGLRAKGEFAIVDYRLEAGLQTGKQKAATDVKFGGYMMDAEVGANFPEFMKARAYVGYHMDTGNDSTTADKNNAYQPLYYDKHQTGLMNVVAWGNLTAIKLGLGLQPMEDTNVGVDAYMFSRSTDKAASAAFNAASGNLTTVPASTSTDKAVGTEIDVWAKHNYTSGFSMLAGVGFFQVGNYYKATGVTVGNAMQVLLQGQYNF